MGPQSKNKNYYAGNGMSQYTKRTCETVTMYGTNNISK